MGSDEWDQMNGTEDKVREAGRRGKVVEMSGFAFESLLFGYLFTNSLYLKYNVLFRRAM